MNKKNMARVAIIFLFIPTLLPGLVFAQSTSEYEVLKADYDKLKKEYENVVRDRDNLRAQAEVLLKYKGDILKAQQELDKINLERSQWELERQTLKNLSQQSQREIEQLRTKLEAMEVIQFQLEAERDEMKKSLSKTKAGYIIVGDLKKSLSEQKKENAVLSQKLGALQKKNAILEDDLSKSEAAIEVLRKQVRELKETYSKTFRANKILEKKLEKQPKEYAEIARENKVLIKRTALMHYNLGVFYTKNKEYIRAIAEFEKAIELNPDDAYAYFNLGYIYAEYYVDRPRAIECFRKYLTLAKKDDKDVDWAKKYILTWQTWEGKEVMK